MRLLPKKYANSLHLKIKQFDRFIKAKTLTKRKGYSKYSIISACYNVEPFIDKFIKSVINQQLSFKRNIELILVDDGSTDRTLEILKKWQKIYPKNIIVLTKKNGGQASARNLGIKYAKNEWINFADPDDFFSLQSFLRIDNFIKRNNNLCMVVMHTKFYFEKTREIKDQHSLSFEFANSQTIRKVKNLDDFIQLATNSVVIKKDVVLREHIEFNEKCKPCFEDARMLNTYLSFCQEKDVAFLRGAVYYYRKREQANSTLDLSWNSNKRYKDVFVYGYIPFLNIANKLWNNKLPRFIQNIIIYDLFWHISRGRNRDYNFNHLTANEKNTYILYLKKAYSYCSKDNIMRYSHGGMGTLFYKIGILGLFKNEKPTFQRVYVEDYDSIKDAAKFRFITHFNVEYTIKINNKIVFPSYSKKVIDTFCGNKFDIQQVIWLSLKSFKDEDELIIDIDNLYTDISLQGKNSRKLKLKNLRKNFKRFFINEKSPYAYCWLISDRDTQADDNGEHFYRWLLQKHPEEKAFFLLNKNSPDWKRLSQDGFKLIAYGSKEHYEALSNCQNIISSSADRYTFNYFCGRKEPRNRPFFTFLQHGITKDDLSSWLNTVKIDLFITSAIPEYDSIAGDYNHYNNLTSREVKLVGFSRYDTLLNVVKKYHKEKIIMIMPSWRLNIVANVYGKTHFRKINYDFKESTFFKYWQNFFIDKRLKKLADKYKFKLLFYPHPNIQQNISLFTIPDYIIVKNSQKCSIQEIFAKSSIMITDYSSVAFDFAYLNKPVLYYQFDYEDCFVNHTHTYSKGYFDYQKNGFGPVCYESSTLFKKLEKILQEKCELENIYKERINNFFKFRDGRCSERIYESIMAMITK